MTRLEQIVALAKQGNSATDIGAALGCSRNAVLGLAFRNGLSIADFNGNRPLPPPQLTTAEKIMRSRRHWELAKLRDRYCPR